MNCRRKFKYKAGDRLGPKNILLIKRTEKKANWQGLFLCPWCGSLFETAISNITSGNTKSCGCFHGIDLTGRKINFTTILSPTKKRDKSGRVIWKCQCDCGRIFYTTSSKIINKTISDCGCKTGSQGEKNINYLLQKLNIKFIQQHFFTDCVNPQTKKYLYFDFYLPDYNCCIEYDGKQHYKEVKTWRESLKEIQKRDSLKNQYCRNNNVKLIRIPYFDYNLIDEEYLLDRIINDN